MENINLNNDDDIKIGEADIFTFKPITQGLGFHQEKVIQPKAKTSIKSSQTLNTHSPSLGRVAPISDLHKKDSSNIPGLQKMYTQNVNQKKIDKKEEKVISVAKVGLEIQFMAWVIDVLVITLGTSLIILSSSFIAFGNFVSPFYNHFSTDFYLLFGCLMSLFYVFYFTLLDLNGTIGKALFSLKVVSIEDKSLEMKETFIRSFVSFLSLLALGIPSVLDFQGKLSKTKIVR